MKVVFYSFSVLVPSYSRPHGEMHMRYATVPHPSATVDMCHRRHHRLARRSGVKDGTLKSRAAGKREKGAFSLFLNPPIRYEANSAEPPERIGSQFRAVDINKIFITNKAMFSDENRE